MVQRSEAEAESAVEATSQTVIDLREGGSAGGLADVAVGARDEHVFVEQVVDAGIDADALRHVIAHLGVDEGCLIAAQGDAFAGVADLREGLRAGIEQLIDVRGAYGDRVLRAQLQPLGRQILDRSSRGRGRTDGAVVGHATG